MVVEFGVSVWMALFLAKVVEMYVLGEGGLNILDERRGVEAVRELDEQEPTRGVMTGKKCEVPGQAGSILKARYAID